MPLDAHSTPKYSTAKDPVQYITLIENGRKMDKPGKKARKVKTHLDNEGRRGQQLIGSVARLISAIRNQQNELATALGVVDMGPAANEVMATHGKTFYELLTKGYEPVKNPHTLAAAISVLAVEFANLGKLAWSTMMKEMWDKRRELKPRQIPEADYPLLNEHVVNRLNELLTVRPEQKEDYMDHDRVANPERYTQIDAARNLAILFGEALAPQRPDHLLVCNFLKQWAKTELPRANTTQPVPFLMEGWTSTPQLNVVHVTHGPLLRTLIEPMTRLIWDRNNKDAEERGQSALVQRQLHVPLVGKKRESSPPPIDYATERAKTKALRDEGDVAGDGERESSGENDGDRR